VARRDIKIFYVLLKNVTARGTIPFSLQVGREGKPFAAVMCNMPIWNAKNVLSFSVKFHPPGSDTKEEGRVRLLLFNHPGNHENLSGMGKPGPKPICY